MRQGWSRGERLHQRVWDLLPWYVNGTLPDGERRKVEEHLSACPRCQEELAACRGIGEAVSRREEVAPAPHPAQLSRLMARIDEEENVLRGLRALFAATPRAVRFALAAQLAAVLLLAGALLRRPEPAPSPLFHTLSSPEPAAEAATRIRIVFAEGTTEKEIREVLLKVRGQVVGGPSPFGVYTVEVPSSPDPLDSVLAHLRSQKGVSLAEPVAGGG